MKKSVFIFILVLSLFLVYTMPTYGEPFLKLDEWDPVDDQYILTPGLALNLELGGSLSSFQGEFDGSWTFNNKMGIKGAGILGTKEGMFYNITSDFYIGITLFWKTGPIYLEIGPQLGYQASVIHTGFNWFLPLIGSSGPAFESNFNLCLYYDLPFTGIVKGGWMWLFGKNSHLLIGGYNVYTLEYTGFYAYPHLGLVELSIDDKIGSFLFDGKVQWDLLSGDGVDGNISVAYMPNSWGFGVNFTTSTIGGALKIRM